MKNLVFFGKKVVQKNQVLTSVTVFFDKQGCIREYPCLTVQIDIENNFHIELQKKKKHR